MTVSLSQECDDFGDSFDTDGLLEEPQHKVVQGNYIAVLNFVHLTMSQFRHLGGPGGSLVIVAAPQHIPLSIVFVVIQGQIYLVDAFGAAAAASALAAHLVIWSPLVPFWI
ncbi:hypothetical protein CFD26_102080 [Aspergillus turcosus]|uniref:Uncharacterized protein n=1 Tax=Aspergillus turcosus TaxID=1245748 RepID=A0A3R7IEK3_9EURO|nr:hypothetical protein CFD26_102080 [Aspergillus turcosus]